MDGFHPETPDRLSGAIRVVRTEDDIDHLVARAGESAGHLQRWIREHDGDGLSLLRALKFDEVGIHPLDGHRLNAIEQVNQIWTFLAALHGARLLMGLHPDAGGYRLAPGAHAAQRLDIMSVVPDLVGAEVFAAVDPRNNRKLSKDIAKLTDQPDTHRYALFVSPRWPTTRRLPQFERDGVQVWSLAA